MSRNQVLTAGGPPRVDLLPPEVGQRKRDRAVRRGLAFFVIAAFIIVGVAFGLATVRSLSAQAELAVSQQRTQELLAEQAQYAEATQVSAALTRASNARSLATSTEVLWNDLYVDIRNALPEGALLFSFAVNGRTPWQPELVPSGPLRAPKVASVTFEVLTLGPMNVEPFVGRLEQLPAYADATPDIELLDKEEIGAYKTTFTLNVSEEALSGRFPLDEAGAE